MKKDKEKRKYESPVTRNTRVNLESGICVASITKDDGTGSKAKATQQEYVEYDFTNENNWD